MQVFTKQERVMFGQIYLSMIECPKHDWHVEICHIGLYYKRATAGTFVLDLLSTQSVLKNRFLIQIILKGIFIDLYEILCIHVIDAIYFDQIHFR